MKHRILRCAIAVALLFAIGVLPTAALTPSYTVTGAYQGSTYHKGLLSIPQTGDRAFDAVAVALTQVGYHEGNSTKDYGGKNSAGSRNYTEYNRFLGTVSGAANYAWCAAFVSWCLAQADAPDSACGSFASCSLWVAALKEAGQYRTRASGYTPAVGDLIFFRSSGVSRASDHVGLVRYVKGGRVYTVEGNASNSVSLSDYLLGDSYIVGYGKPRYGSAYTMATTHLAAEDRFAGYYTVTNSFVNLRATPSASGSKLGSLSRGTTVRVEEIKNGWARILQSGKTAYFSLEYADFTSPLIFTVSYLTSDSQGSPFKTTHYSTETARVTDTVPSAENAVFTGWKDDFDRVYQAGDPLPAGDIRLTAIWEVKEVLDEPTDDGDDSVIGDIFFSPPESEEGESTPPPEGEEAPPKSHASTAASIITAVGGAALFGVWYWRRRKEREGA